ncbi:5-methylcytosine restriction system specificity protein McrC [Agrobacterium sp.]|uniref:5-methylcytosine restriction system specificity protein McrC n=1 Tax=Agrobacterium sp. TaxID=361 RepID=UPI0028AAC598|nr:hypothetical protein [Agrobacterium sp.]
MRVISINVFEHQPVPLPPALDNDRIRRRLVRAGRSELGPALKLDQKRLTATGLVGLVSTPSVQIQILPKVYEAEDASVARGMQFLQATFPLALAGRFGSGKAYAASSSDRIIDIILAYFLARLAELISWEFPRSYFEVTELRDSLAGRVDLNSLASRMPGTMRGVMVRHAPLQADNNTSRLCRAVVEESMTKAHDGKLIWQARQLQSLLSDVRSVPLSVELIEGAKAEVRSADWEWLFTLANLLVKQRTSNPWEAGGEAGLGILYRIEHLFEKAVRLALARGIERKCGGTVRKDGLGCVLRTADGGSFVNLKPDLIIHLGSGQLLGDSKWKRLRSLADPVPAENDLYQILTYSRAANVAKCFIIYPLGRPHSDVVVKNVYEAFAGAVKVAVLQVDILQLLQTDPGLRASAEDKLAAVVASI